MKARTSGEPPLVEGGGPERVRALNAGALRIGRFLLYWMQQSQRAEENAALEYAIGVANHCRLPLVVVFGLTSSFPEATARAYSFMLEGLVETREGCSSSRSRLCPASRRSTGGRVVGGESRCCSHHL